MALEGWVEVKKSKVAEAVRKELAPEKDLRTEASELLAQWGLWARLNKLPGCYSTQPWYTPPRGYQEDSTPVDIYDCPLIINDEQALKVDQHIAGIGRLGDFYLAVTKWRFIGGFSQREISERLNLPKTKIQDYLKQTVTWVAAIA